MHLIAPLVSGITGAESGSASIYTRGTSTRATYYLDFEANNPVATGADVALDSNGGATIYVNQYVDVVVKNSQGVTVRTFTAGDAAPNIEYIGESFTGNDYTTGAAGVNKPVNLQTILNAWKTSAGAVDFNVLLGTVSTSIQAAIGTISGFFYNVKSSTYGAVGDGVADDTTSIVNAVTAANAAGGGTIFFPKGTYRITTAITIPYNVSFLGVGPYSSILSIDHASNNCIVLSGASTGGYQKICDLGFTAMQAHTGDLLNIVVDATYVSVEKCSFGGANTNGMLARFKANHCYVMIDSCDFRPGEIPTTKAAVNIWKDGAVGDFHTWAAITNSTFTIRSTQTATNVYFLETDVGLVSGCIFDASPAVNAVTIYGINIGGTYSELSGLSIVNNRFVGSASATVYGIDPAGTNYYFYENGNFASFNTTALYGNTAPTSGDSYRHLGSREGKLIEYADESATITLDARNNSSIHLTRSTNAVQTISATSAPIGGYLTLLIHNTSGAGSGNISFSATSFIENTGTFTIAASRSRIFHFRSAGNTPIWFLIADSGDLVY